MAALVRFRETYPQDRVRWGSTQIAERNAGDVVVAVEFDTDWMPAPTRFFRVSDEGVVSECPPEYWPRGWGIVL